MDRAKMADAIRAFIEGLEQPLDRETDATPDRVARAWADELVRGYEQDPAALLSWAPAPEGSGLVLVRDVRFASVCMHHLLPFSGVAHVAYLPGERLAGLSKIGRVIEAHARRLQIQERLTIEIVRTIDTVLRPRGVLALLEAEHTCMTLRGSRKEGSSMLTLHGSGLYAEEHNARAEVLALLRKPPTVP